MLILQLPKINGQYKINLNSIGLSGTIPLENLPPTALERIYVVADQAARYALTTNEVQNGDTVKQNDDGSMWMVKDDTNLGNASGYEEYTAATAASCPWTGLTGVPAQITALSTFDTNGLITQTATGVYTGRTITNTANRTTITNGNGVSGNPVIDIDVTLLPSPVGGDAGRFLKTTAADTGVWTAIQQSDITGLKTTDAVQFARLGLGGAAHSTDQLAWTDGTSIGKLAVSTGVYIGSRSNHNVFLQANNTTFLTLQTTGNVEHVGDKDSSLYYRIDNPNAGVSSEAALLIQNNADNALQLTMYGSNHSTNPGLGLIQTNTGALKINAAGSNTLTLATNSADRITVASNGFIELKNYTTIDLDAVSGNATWLQFNRQDNKKFALYTETSNDNLILENSAGSSIIEFKSNKDTIFSGNVGIGTSLFGTSADKVISFVNGTAPTTSITDGVQIFSRNAANQNDKAILHMVGESGTDPLIVAGIVYKDSTGDISYSHEGIMVINTVDNNIKMYADGGFRTLVTW